VALTSTPPPATSTAQAVGGFLAAVTVSSRVVGIGTLLGGGDTEYSEPVSVHSTSSPVAGATLFLDGAATVIGGWGGAGGRGNDGTFVAWWLAAPPPLVL
jgi:hypothetical protein